MELVISPSPCRNIRFPFLLGPALTPKTCLKGKDSFLKESIKKASSFEDAFH